MINNNTAQNARIERAPNTVKWNGKLFVVIRELFPFRACSKVFKTTSCNPWISFLDTFNFWLGIPYRSLGDGVDGMLLVKCGSEQIHGILSLNKICGKNTQNPWNVRLEWSIYGQVVGWFLCWETGCKWDIMFFGYFINFGVCFDYRLSIHFMELF